MKKQGVKMARYTTGTYDALLELVEEYDELVIKTTEEGMISLALWKGSDLMGYQEGITLEECIFELYGGRGQ